jgi:alkylation response protein AidB-like acyl-CoA dehydrogenase
VAARGNVLGEIGVGHHDHNVLNVGRFNRAGCIGGARSSIESAIGHAKQRKHLRACFRLRSGPGKPGQHGRGFVGEAWPITVGMMDAAIAQLDAHDDMVRP